MVAANRPLKKTEILTVLATLETGSAQGHEYLEDYDDLFSDCDSIFYIDSTISTEDVTLNFCHQSAQDFLLSTVDAWYGTSEDRVNLVMFKACWKYLIEHEVHKRSWLIGREEDCDSEPELEEYFSELFWEYSSSEWDNHAMASVPALHSNFQQLGINVSRAPTLRDLWLQRATVEGQEATAKLLLENGAEICGPKSWDLLSRVVERGYEGIVKLLIEYGAAVNSAPYRSGLTPLWLATDMGHEDIVKLLIEKDADVNSGDHRSGWTPLCVAADRGYEGIVRLLLNNGAEASLKDTKGQTPLSRAKARGHEAIVGMLQCKSE